MSTTSPTLRTISAAALVAEFIDAAAWAASNPCPEYLAHFDLVAAEMDRRGLKG